MSSFEFASDSGAEDLTKKALASMEGGGIEVSDRDLRVTMGEPPMFSAVIPRASIRKAIQRPDLETASRGIHGRSGKWLVNRAGTGLVKLTISPPARASLNPPMVLKNPGRIVRFFARARTIKLSELTVSASPPEELIRELGF
ncbi:MAG: hypothetical protein ABR507_01375 [Actinomycetota bacterium]|nr:hypothetical protein [Actinomycetota bacterium]